IKNCIGPDRHPIKPEITLPKGSIDAHVHVFEARYPLSPTRGYNPAESTLDDLKHLHATLGIDRTVFTQPSPYAVDNQAMIDGVNTLNAEVPGRARMVVAVDGDVTEEQIAIWDQQGGRGIRCNLDSRGGMLIELSEIPDLEAKLKPFGWHIEWLFPGEDIDDLMPVFKKITIPMSIAHFAYQPATAGVGASGFQTLLRLVRDGNTWIKISGANRVSATDLPPYDDLKPMAHALIEANPERVIWGTDWPHPNKYDANPNDGDLVNAFGDWVTDEAMRKTIMVETAAAFYRF
ncbi:MAG: amidohydrolase family protein, partial [Geminicoccaceae bacterium]